MGADLLDFGLEYLRRYGWSVFPVRGKLPTGKWKNFQSERPTERELRRMFERPDMTGLAVILGQVSGDLWARDFDEAEAYPRWAAAFPDLARRTPTVATARGAHVYGCWPAITFAALEDGELRAGGGCYCLLPPSKHPSGVLYTWRIPPAATIPRLDPATCGLKKTWSVTQEHRNTGTQVTQEPSGRGGETEAPERAGGVPSDVIRKTIPDGPSQNHKALFDLARRVRGLEVDRGGAFTLAALRQALAAWCAQNPHVNPERMEVDYVAEFLTAYGDVRVPFGADGTLDIAWKAALVAAPPPEAAEYGEALGLLAAWCRELQRVAGARAFYLGARTVQERFKLAAPLLAWRRLKLLIRLGILEQVEAGDRRRAATFRYRLPLEP